LVAVTVTVTVYTPAARLVAFNVPIVAVVPVPGVNDTPAGRPETESHADDVAPTGVVDDVVMTKVVVESGEVTPADGDVKVGADVGMTLTDGVDALPGPTALVATTVKVYLVPFVRPAMVQFVVVLVQVAPPGLAETV
jgi:hypothetical protein